MGSPGVPGTPGIPPPVRTGEEAPEKQFSPKATHLPNEVDISALIEVVGSEYFLMPRTLACRRTCQGPAWETRYVARTPSRYDTGHVKEGRGAFEGSDFFTNKNFYHELVRSKLVKPRTASPFWVERNSWAHQQSSITNFRTSKESTGGISRI